MFTVFPVAASRSLTLILFLLVQSSRHNSLTHQREHEASESDEILFQRICFDALNWKVSDDESVARLCRSFTRCRNSTKKLHCPIEMISELKLLVGTGQAREHRRADNFSKTHNVFFHNDHLLTILQLSLLKEEDGGCSPRLDPVNVSLRTTQHQARLRWTLPRNGGRAYESRCCTDCPSNNFFQNVWQGKSCSHLTDSQSSDPT